MNFQQKVQGKCRYDTGWVGFNIFYAMTKIYQSQHHGVDTSVDNNVAECALQVWIFQTNVKGNNL